VSVEIEEIEYVVDQMAPSGLPVILEHLEIRLSPSSTTTISAVQDRLEL